MTLAKLNILTDAELYGLLASALLVGWALGWFMKRLGRLLREGE